MSREPKESGRFSEKADIVTASDDYASRFAGPTGEWMLGVQSDIILSRAKERGIQTVLDVGGGHGQLALPLAKAGFDVVVLGSDESCAKRVQPAMEIGSVQFIVGDVINLPFDDHAFDLVVSVRLLPHCRQWPRLISEFCRVAKKAVIVDYPAKHGCNAVAPLFFGAKKKLEGNTRTWTDFTNREVASEFEKNAFKLVHRQGQFFFPMVLHRTLKRRSVSTALEAPFRMMGLTSRWGSPVLAEFEPTDYTN